MSSVWKEPIFDRTIEDIENAIKKLTNWKESHTHKADVRVVNDSLVVQDVGSAYVNNDELVVESRGAVYVEDSVLALDLDDVYDLKGCLNLADLNRIEGNIAYITEVMESNLYFPDIRGRVWTSSDIPNEDDMKRIIANTRSLISEYYKHYSSPELPVTMLSYRDINAIEENLYLLKQLLDIMQSSFKKSGTIKCGSTMFLPIRR